MHHVILLPCVKARDNISQHIDLPRAMTRLLLGDVVMNARFILVSPSSFATTFCEQRE